MRERPISFNSEMVCAILDGRKTQTRRVIKEPKWSTPEMTGVEFSYPYGVPGDRLWVRENFYECTDNNDSIKYAADGLPPTTDRRHYRKRPSIFMSRNLSRITLEIIEIRVERVQEITEDDARQEGIVDGGCLECGEHEPCGCQNPTPSARDAFIYLWNSIYRIRGYGWDTNPYVYVIHFKKVED